MSVALHKRFDRRGMGATPSPPFDCQGVGTASEHGFARGGQRHLVPTAQRLSLDACCRSISRRERRCSATSTLGGIAASGKPPIIISCSHDPSGPDRALDRAWAQRRCIADNVHGERQAVERAHDLLDTVSTEYVAPPTGLVEALDLIGGIVIRAGPHCFAHRTSSAQASRSAFGVCRHSSRSDESPDRRRSVTC